jgi:hypothetical protein
VLLRKKTKTRTHREKIAATAAIHKALDANNKLKLIIKNLQSQSSHRDEVYNESLDELSTERSDLVRANQDLANTLQRLLLLPSKPVSTSPPAPSFAHLQQPQPEQSHKLQDPQVSQAVSAHYTHRAHVTKSVTSVSPSPSQALRIELPCFPPPLSVSNNG